MKPPIPQITLNDTGYYTIYRSSQLVLPFRLEYATGKIFRVAHTNFGKNQSFTVKFWVSETPGGISVSGWPVGQYRFVIPCQKGISFVYYDSSFPVPDIRDAIFTWPLAWQNQYYLNVQNLENRDNGFYLRIEDYPM